MSTNIQIDVVLQRLKDQAQQVLQQNQQERQQRESAQTVLEPVQLIRNDVSTSALSRGLNALADLRRQSADKHSSVPDPYKKRRPAAQRLDGAVSGVRFQWGTYDRFYPINSGLRGAYLTVANATRTQVLDWRGVDFPNAEKFSALLPLDGGNAMFIWTGNPNGWVPSNQIAGNLSTEFVPIKPENITKAVLVTPDSLREITPPAGLTAKMRAWEALAYFEDQWALTRHFGMLQPSGVYNGTLLYWTPAVFSGLSGATFSATQADRRNYAFMRANYFPKAPRQFLATEDYAAPTYDPLLQQWRVTRFQPETITSPVPTNQLQPANRSYSVKISDNQEGDQFYWAWDWGSPAFCRQQLLALGFTTADLKP